MRRLALALVLATGTTLFSFSALSGPAGAADPGAAPSTAPIPAGRYTVDPGHSGVLFRIQHMGVANFWGRFNKIEGSFDLADKAADCSVEITIDAGSIDTNSEGRDKHVRGPEFFNVAEYPEVTFTSKRIAIKGDVYTVQGELKILGKTQSVTIPMTKTGEADTRMGPRCGFEGEFSFNRKDFGMSALEGGLGTEIRCILFVEAVKQ